MMRTTRLYLLVAVCSVAAPVLAQNRLPKGAFTDFNVPEEDEQGNLRWNLHGDRGRMRSENLVELEGVKVEFYRDGKVDMTVTTTGCLFDRREKQATTDGTVEIQAGNYQITGRGLEWQSGKSLVQMNRDVKIVLPHGLKTTAGVVPAADAPKIPTVITSERGAFDTSRRVVTLEGKVVVEDLEMKLRADKMLVTFAGDNQAQQIEATGNVEIQQKDIAARGERAMYTRVDGKMVLTGNPTVKQPQWKVDGTEIVFFHEQQLVICQQVRLFLEQGAAGLTAKPDPAKPMTFVVAEHGAFDPKTRTAALEGNVVVTDPQMVLTAKRLNLTLDEKSEVSRIDAMGGVVMKQMEKTARGERAVYTRSDGRVVLTGDPSVTDSQGNVRGEEIVFNKDSDTMVVERCVLTLQETAAGATALLPDQPNVPAKKGPTVVRAGRGTFAGQKRTARFDQNVAVDAPDMQLTATTMDVIFDDKQAIMRLEADGDVRITQQGKSARGDHAVYTPRDGNVALTGRTWIEMADGSVECETITYNRTTQKFIFSGNARLTIKGGAASIPNLLPKKEAAKP